jgi:hypothetical protein
MSRDEEDTETNQTKKLERRKKRKRTQKLQREEEGSAQRSRCPDSDRDNPRAHDNSSISEQNGTTSC